MQVDDESLFREYYELKQGSGVPFLYFYHKMKHIRNSPRMSPRKFYLKFKRWLLDHDLEDIYHSTSDYMAWIMDHFSATPEQRNKCIEIHYVLKGKTKPPFTELYVAVSIFTLSGEINISSIADEMGLKSETISRCRTWIGLHADTDAPKTESINTYPVFSNQ